MARKRRGRQKERKTLLIDQSLLFLPLALLVVSLSALGEKSKRERERERVVDIRLPLSTCMQGHWGRRNSGSRIKRERVLCFSSVVLFLHGLRARCVFSVEKEEKESTFAVQGE